MKTRDKIISTSINLFNLHGTKSISTNHIAKEMGISPGIYTITLEARMI